MNEKRFYISSDSNQNIYDTVLGCYYSSIDAIRVCDLLNELNDDAMNYQTLYKQQIEKNKELRKDNEALRKKYKALKHDFEALL